MEMNADQNAESRMRHVVYDRFGEHDVLQVVQSDVPEPGTGQVLVRVHGAGLNPIDWKTRKGLGFAARQIENSLPWTPGYDVAGEVLAVGDDVTTLAPGDRVMGMVGFPAGGGGMPSMCWQRQTSLLSCRKSLIWLRRVLCRWLR